MLPALQWGYWLAAGAVLALVTWFGCTRRRFAILSDYYRAAGRDTLASDAASLLEGPHVLVLAQFGMTAAALQFQRGRLHAGDPSLAGLLLAAGAAFLLVPFLTRGVRLQFYLGFLLVLSGLAVRWPVQAVWACVGVLLLSVGYEVRVGRLLGKATVRQTGGIFRVAVEDGSFVATGALTVTAALAATIHAVGPQTGSRIAGWVAVGFACVARLVLGAACAEAGCGLGMALWYLCLPIGYPLRLLGLLPIWRPVVQRAFPEVTSRAEPAPARTEER